MILSPKSPFLRKPTLILQRGFTLIEVLVACAVLMLIVAMLFQMMNMMSKTWVAGRAQAETSVTARAMLDLIAEDIGESVSRPDLPAFRDASGQPALIFYTQRQGVTPQGNTNLMRPLSLVSYDTNNIENGSLFRYDLPQNWTTNTGWPFEQDAKIAQASSLIINTNTGSDPNEIASGIIAFNFAFLARDQSLTANYYPPTSSDPYYTNNNVNGKVGYDPTKVSRAVVVSLAMVDAKTLNLLTLTGKLQQLQSAQFWTSTNVSQHMLANWQDAISGQGAYAGQGGQLAKSGLPSAVAANLLILERTIPLPIQQ